MECAFWSPIRGPPISPLPLALLKVASRHTPKLNCRFTLPLPLEADPTLIVVGFHDLSLNLHFDTWIIILAGEAQGTQLASHFDIWTSFWAGEAQQTQLGRHTTPELLSW